MPVDIVLNRVANFAILDVNSRNRVAVGSLGNQVRIGKDLLTDFSREWRRHGWKWGETDNTDTFSKRSGDDADL